MPLPFATRLLSKSRGFGRSSTSVPLHRHLSSSVLGSKSRRVLSRFRAGFSPQSSHRGTKLPNALIPCSTVRIPSPWEARITMLHTSKRRCQEEKGSEAGGGLSEAGGGVSGVEVDKKIAVPTMSQLRIHGINCAIPMIGFGFMDNMVMIQAGDFIDNHIGVAFGLTTLTAAAFGQVCSDVSGVCFGGVIEEFAAKMGLPQSTLTKSQLNSKRVRLFSTACAAIGVVIGCLLGMISLLFMDLDRAERQKKAKKLGGLFDTLVRDGRRILGAQRCNLWLVTEDGEHLWSRAFTGEIPKRERLRRVFDRYDEDHSNSINAENLIGVFKKLGWDIDEREILDKIHNFRQEKEKKKKRRGSVGNTLKNNSGAGDSKTHTQTGTQQVDLESIDFGEFQQLIKFILKEERRIPIRKGGAKHTVLTSGKVVNIQNAYATSRYQRNFRAKGGSTRNFDKYTGYDTFSVLLVPVVVEDPKRVIGLIEFANKSVDGIGYQAFSKNDEKVAALLASVASSFIAETIAPSD